MDETSAGKPKEKPDPETLDSAGTLTATKPTVEVSGRSNKSTDSPFELPEALPAESLEPPPLPPPLPPPDDPEPAAAVDGAGAELDDPDSELGAGADVAFGAGAGDELELGADDAGGAEDSLGADIDPGAGLPLGLGTGAGLILGPGIGAGPPLGLGTGAGLLLGTGTGAGVVLGRGAEGPGKADGKIALGGAEGRDGDGGGPPEIIVVNFIVPKLDTPEFSMARALFLID